MADGYIERLRVLVVLRKLPLQKLVERKFDPRERRLGSCCWF